MTENIDELLEKMATKHQAAFNSKLVPGSKPILGVKIPELRKMAKQIAKQDYKKFLTEYPEEYYEHELLKAFVIGYAKDDFETVIKYADEFVPKIHDWAVNDAFCQTFSIARKNREETWEWLSKYVTSDAEFPQRVVAVLLMSHFLVDEYIDRVLECMNRLKYDGYYTKMGVAWCVATAYAKYPGKTLEFLKDNELDDWTYNKSIQKMAESFRVSDEDKKMLKKMKRK
ncbi:MAG: DNA alkylation repair protein [Clostridia bacterium]|nr:DNA alkylation repair protein [Clostridia bacterium]